MTTLSKMPRNFLLLRLFPRLKQKFKEFIQISVASDVNNLREDVMKAIEIDSS